jgi:flagellin
MGLQINTNELALSAQRNLEDTNRRLHTVIRRVASGSRIVQASDDPAGLAISDALNSEIRSLGQAVRNAQDAISVIQIYEGGTNEINNMTMRIRELAMQAASDTVGDRERGMLNNEVVQLKEEIERISHTTKFAGQELLSGQTVQMDFQVGIHNDPKIDRISFNPGDTNMTIGALGIDDVDVLSKENAQNSLEVLDSTLNKVNEIRARVGATQSRLTTTMNATGIFQENLMAAKSRIRDADLAAESANYARETILRKAGVAVLVQANETPALALQLLRT